MRALIRVSVLLLIGSSWAGAADDPPRNTPPFTRFKLTRFGILNVTLPFDVPFILWGDVPRDTTHVTMRLATTDRGTACGAVPVTAFGGPNRVETHNWLASDYQDRGQTAPATPETDSLVQFELVANPLQPSRTYCVMLQLEPGRALVPSETITLTEALVPAFEQFVEEQGDSLESKDRDEIEPLRQHLIRALLAADPLGSFRPLPGTPFDPDVDSAAVRATFLSSATRIFSAYLDLLRQLRVFQFQDVGPNELDPGPARHDRFLANWRRWRSSADFTRLVDASDLTSNQRIAVTYVAALNERQRSNELVGVPPAARVEVLTRVDSFDPDFPPPPAPDGIYPPDHSCPRAGTVADRCAELDKVQTYLVLVRNAATAKGFTALADDVDTSVEDFAGQKIRLLNIQNDRRVEHEAVVAEIEGLKGTVLASVRLVGTTRAGAETRRSWYISMDTGVAVAPVISEVFPYVGTNIYFRPVNKDAPPGPFLTRFAALLGFTWTTNLTEAGQREALYGEDAMLVVGGGLRFTEVLRGSGGVLLFKGVDPNPLLNKTTLSVTPFFSLSADIDLGGIIAGVFGVKPATPAVKPGGN